MDQPNASVNPDVPAPASTSPPTIAIVSLVRRTNIWQWLLAAAIAWYVIRFAGFSSDIHRGLGTSSFDLGLYDQGVWLMSRFKAPFVTLMGRNLMGDHTSFILVLVVPFYWLAPGVGTLLFLQAAAVGAGAIPIYMYARRRLESGWMALICAVCYLLHPAVSGTNLENFHPDAFLGVLVGFAIYGALERRWRIYTVFVVLSLLVKEDVSFVIVPLGVWVALRRDRRIGLITVAGSIGFMVVAMLVVMRGLIGVSTRNTWRIPFGGPFGFVRHTLRQPGETYDHLRSDSRPFYLWQMTAPFAYVFAKVPGVASISALVLLTNIVSTFSYQHSTSYHYSMIAVPALAMGSVYAIGAIGATVRWRTVLLIAITSLYASFLWGWMPWSRHEYPRWAPDHPVAEALRDIIDDIPSDAAVAAYHSATPHLSHRTEIYQFPNPFRIVLFGTDLSLEGTRDAERAERIDFVVLPTSLDERGQEEWAVVAPAFDQIAANEGWVLYHRDRTEALPPLPPSDG